MLDSLGFHFCQSWDFFFYLQNVWIRPGPTQPPIRCELGAFPIGVKQLLWEVHHSRPCGTEVKNEWSYISAPVFLPYMHRDNFTFTFTLIAVYIEFARMYQSLFFASINFVLFRHSLWNKIDHIVWTPCLSVCPSWPSVGDWTVAGF